MQRKLIKLELRRHTQTWPLDEYPGRKTEGEGVHTLAIMPTTDTERMVRADVIFGYNNRGEGTRDAKDRKASGMWAHALGSHYAIFFTNGKQFVSGRFSGNTRFVKEVVYTTYMRSVFKMVEKPNASVEIRRSGV